MSAEQTHEPTEWQPGDPLNQWDSRPHMNVGLYNFRLDNDREECHCADAASWPEPNHKWLPAGDEIGDLIAWHRAQREAS